MLWLLLNPFLIREIRFMKNINHLFWKFKGLRRSWFCFFVISAVDCTGSNLEIEMPRPTVHRFGCEPMQPNPLTALGNKWFCFIT